MDALRAMFELARDTFREWTEDRVPRLGAALAYYTILSLAPLIIIATLIAGSFFGSQEFAQARLVAQISQFVGQDAAEFVNTLVNNARLPRAAGNLTIGIGVAALLFGALAVFGQLQDAFDTIWEVKHDPAGNVLRFVRNRALAFTMLLVVGFLLLLLLLANAVLRAVGGYLETRIANYGLYAALVNDLVPFLFAAVLIAIMFKVLPSVQLAWRDVLPGAVLTALLFSLSQYAIGFYLSRTRLGTAEGGATSVLVVLVWVFLSAQILFLGAEFTQVYVKRYARRRPKLVEDTVPVSEAERVHQGIPHRPAAAPAQGPLQSQAAAQRRHWDWPRVCSAGHGQRGPRPIMGLLLGFVAGLGAGAAMALLTLRGGASRPGWPAR